MLRASAQTTQTEIDIQGINGDRNAAALGVEHGAELMSFAEAVAGGDPTELQAARESCVIYRLCFQTTRSIKMI